MSPGKERKREKESSKEKERKREISNTNSNSKYSSALSKTNSNSKYRSAFKTPCVVFLGIDILPYSFFDFVFEKARALFFDFELVSLLDESEHGGSNDRINTS
jgi:hypothetical protein